MIKVEQSGEGAMLSTDNTSVKKRDAAAENDETASPSGFADPLTIQDMQQRQVRVASEAGVLRGEQLDVADSNARYLFIYIGTTPIQIFQPPIISYLLLEFLSGKNINNTKPVTMINVIKYFPVCLSLTSAASLSMPVSSWCHRREIRVHATPDGRRFLVDEDKRPVINRQTGRSAHRNPLARLFPRVLDCAPPATAVLIGGSFAVRANLLF
jgi:hypothetical protein